MTERAPDTSSLPRPPERTDVVVVGAGIAGASAAWHLASSGVDVTVLERDRVGCGATGAAVGLLAPPLRQPFDETVRFHGAEQAALAWRFALASAGALADLVEEHDTSGTLGLDRDGATVLADAGTLPDVESAFQALSDAGLPVTWVSAEEVADGPSGGAFLGGYRVEGPAAVDGRGVARLLARLAGDGGASVHEGVAVDAVDGVSGGLRVAAGDLRIDCEMVVYATHVESRRFSQFLGDEVVPVLGQALVTEPLAHRRSGAFSTHWKMNTWRQDPEGRLWLGGWRWDSWDRSYWKLRPAVDDALQSDLTSWYERAFPGAAPLTVARRWGGIYGWTADSLPLAGPLPGSPRELVTAGFGGGGLAFAFDCGRVVADVVAGRDPLPGGELLNPRRFT